MSEASARFGAAASLLLIALLGLFMAVSAAAALPLMGLFMMGGLMLFFGEAHWAMVALVSALLFLAFWSMAIGVETLADPQPGAVGWAAVRTVLLLGGLALLAGA